jgi:hypothetical protein
VIDPEELAICKRRGHVADITVHGWSPCTACGLWLREKRTVEEREDEPPEAEMDPGVRSDRSLARMLGKRPPAD